MSIAGNFPYGNKSAGPFREIAVGDRNDQIGKHPTTVLLIQRHEFIIAREIGFIALLKRNSG
jgi:hypothetical protein